MQEEEEEEDGDKCSTQLRILLNSFKVLLTLDPNNPKSSHRHLRDSSRTPCGSLPVEPKAFPPRVLMEAGL